MKAGQALYEAAREKVENVAKDNCPYEDGTLQGTIETLQPEYSERGVTVRVVAGGPSAPYALSIHEHLSKYSPPSWKKAEANGHPVKFKVGGPKYLERALNAAEGQILDEVGKRIEIKE